MNNLVYNLLNKRYPKVELDDKYIDNLYSLYQSYSDKFGYEIYINKEDFKKIFKIAYDVLRFKVNFEDFLIIGDHCTRLLIADAQDKEYVDSKWMIDHIWYLSTGLSNYIDTNKYKDCIPFIQELLVKEFNVEENLKDKFSRKVFTKFMTN